MPKTAPKRKVLFVITKSNFGGAQRYVFDLATNLPKDRFDVTVACGGQGELVKRLKAYDVRVIEIPSLERDISLLRELRAFSQLFSIIRNERPNILHVNSSKAAGLGALAGRLLGIKRMVFTGHGWAFNEARPYWQKALIAFLLLITIMLVDKTITVSEKTKRDIVKHIPFIDSRITVIYNGISPIKFEPRDAARRFLATFAPNHSMNDASILSGRWIGFHGEIHKNKGIDIGVRALAPVLERHPDLYFVVVGIGDWSERVQKLVSERRLDGRVFFLGSVPDARNYVTAYDLFVLPSRTEALPYAIIEAGFASLPLIASRVGGIPEIVEHMKSGLLVEPSDEKGLADAIEMLLSDRSLAEALGTEIQKTVAKKFALPIMLEKTLDVYGA